MTFCFLSGRHPHGASHLLSCLAVLVASAVLAAAAVEQQRQEPPTISEGPHIQFATTTNDFGRIIAGTTVKHEFFFTNTGSQLLLILEIRSFCGCTAAMGLGKVEPRGEGKIPVELYSSGIDGAFDKSLLVSCNDPTNTQVALHLRGTVWHPIKVTPPSAAFAGSLSSPESLARVLKIKNQEKEPLILSLPRSSHRQFTAQLKAITEGQEYQLTVSLVPPLGNGNVFGDVQINTSHRTMPVLKIPVWAISQGGVLVFPRKLELTQGPLSRKEVRKVAIQNNLAAALALGTPVISTPGVEAQLTEEQEGQKFTVTLTFPEGYALPPEGAQLTLQSNQPGSPEIKVPILAGTGGDDLQR